MSSFSHLAFEKKVSDLTMSQQSIQTLSLWCIHHRKHAKLVVQIWHKELNRVRTKKKLVLMYLSNDILQNSRRKGPEYAKEFSHVLPSAFHHCAKECDEKVASALKRILNIWLERDVYENGFIGRLRKALEIKKPTTAIDSEEESTTPPPEKKSKLEDLRRPKHPPDPDELVSKLQDLENSATQDAIVRERIANLPTEVTDPTYIDKVQDLRSARKLSQKINEACEILSEYNARLAAEQIDRQKAQKMLVDYIASQKFQQALVENRVEEYQTKLEKVTTVRKELKSHLDNLPDLSKLPNPVPLPSAGDLFGTPSKRR